MRTILLCLVLSSTIAGAQISFPGYLPQQCQSAAKGAIADAPDGIVVAITAIGVAIPLGSSSIYLGMDFTTGTSPMWIYSVYSKQKDTAVIAPLMRIIGSCSPPPIEIPDGELELDEVPTVDLPAKYLQGSELLNRLKTDAAYNLFRATYPDSMPMFVSLTTAQESLGPVVAGEPAWVMIWVPSNEQAFPFTCVVNANTGETLCLGSNTLSVHNSSNHQDGMLITPNPASDYVYVTLPHEMMGSDVRVEAVDVAGHIVPLYNSRLASQPLHIRTSDLSQGVWTFLVHNNKRYVATPVVIHR